MNWVGERKYREHPEWFRDEDEEFSDEPDAVIRRLEKKLDKLATALSIDLDGSGYMDKPITDRIEERFAQIEEKIEPLEQIEDTVREINRSTEWEYSSNNIGSIKNDLYELQSMFKNQKSNNLLQKLADELNNFQDRTMIGFIVIGIGLVVVFIFS